MREGGDEVGGEARGWVGEGGGIRRFGGEGIGAGGEVSVCGGGGVLETGWGGASIQNR